MAWLGTWANRQRIEIDNADIDSDLTFFPVPIVLGSSVGKNNFNTADIFNNIGDFTNRKKIAITKEDGTTQLYGEIEFWNQAEGKAIIWVSKPDFVISSSNKTILYFYYDFAQSENTSYIGDTGDAAAQNVWDSNFQTIQHMVDNTTSIVLDSTANGNTGTKYAANEPLEATFASTIGQHFDGVNDYVNCGTDSSLDATNKITVEALVKTGSQDSQNIFDKYFSSSDAGYGITVGGGLLDMHGRDGSGSYRGLTGVTSFADNSWHYVVGTVNINLWEIWLDSVKENTLDTGYTGTNLTNPAPAAIGSHPQDTGVSIFNGDIAEVRLSKISRSDDWIKATYKALTDSLISFGIAFSGTVTSGAAGISRKINFYEEPDLSTSIGSVVSETDGTWEIILGVNPSAYVTAICEGDVGEQSQIFNKISVG